jgi:hypothetical protein
MDSSAIWFTWGFKSVIEQGSSGLGTGIVRAGREA